MNNQADVREKIIPESARGSTMAYLVAGLGVGAALSIFLAPQSGAETRRWIANKCLNGIDTANEKVRKTRVQMKELLDQGQEKISEAVTAGREAVGKSKAAASYGGCRIGTGTILVAVPWIVSTSSLVREITRAPALKRESGS